MISDTLFLINIGAHTASFARAGSLAISRSLGNRFLEISCDFEPNEKLKDLKDKDGIVYLAGDAAMPNYSGLSWLESLGHWKRPVGLMISPDDEGNIPGIATAYISLCKSKQVPLAGLIQLGGIWDPKARRLDCLPWCGHIPNEFLVENLSPHSIGLNKILILEELILNIKKEINKVRL